MGRVLPVLVLLALTIYAVVDLTQTDPLDVPYMPKWMWLIVVICLPGIGPLAWIILGHRGVGNSQYTDPLPPDDNPDWLNRH